MNVYKNLLARARGQQEKPATVLQPSQPPLDAGDRVRIRSAGEIQLTLDHFSRLKGCSFAPEMREYCGTVQRVLKPVRRFADERDMTIRNTRGIVILENITCKGTAAFGPCDRNCFLFWREEWLEKSN